MPGALFAPVCSIVPTRRRRFLWAAWWTAGPTRSPFRKPDAFEGGARTREEAKLAAERAAGCHLLEIEGTWARAWGNVLVGKEPWPQKHALPGAAGASEARARLSPNLSRWQLLGLTPGASQLEIKRAYRSRALQVHPDRGGSDAAFRSLHAAYESALRDSARPRPKKR